MKNKSHNDFYDTDTGLLVYLKGLDNCGLILVDASGNLNYI